MLRLIRLMLLGAVLSLASVAHGEADATPPVGVTPAAAPVKVGVILAPPFVMQTATGYGGMAIDLWQNVADKLGLSYQYERLPTFKALLDAVAAGKVDIAVMDLTITQDRLQRMDFTQPWFDSGQRVMIESTQRWSFVTFIQNMERSGHLQVYLGIAILILIATAALTIFDRYFDEEFHPEWHKGFIESFYQVVSVATSGKNSHKRLFGVYGRIIAALWMVCGVGVVAYVTSSITSVMTTTSLTSQITSKTSLPGKTVGVLKGTVGEAYCFDEALACVSYDTPGEMVAALQDRSIDALIGDAAILEYYAHTHPKQPVAVVGGLFRREKIGFATPLGSPLTRPMTLAIVADMQSGLIDRLHAKYFGDQE